MTEVFLVVGSGATADADLLKARSLGDFPPVAVNRAIAACPGVLFAGATLHPEMAADFRASRPGRWPLIAPAPAPGVSVTFPARPMWNGTSALYATRFLLALWPDARVILCGCPLEGPYADGRPPMRFLNHYRAAWSLAKAELAGRVRSLSGWTAWTLGTPDHPFLNPAA